MPLIDVSMGKNKLKDKAFPCSYRVLARVDPEKCPCPDNSQRINKNILVVLSFTLSSVFGLSAAFSFLLILLMAMSISFFVQSLHYIVGNSLLIMSWWLLDLDQPTIAGTPCWFSGSIKLATRPLL